MDRDAAGRPRYSWKAGADRLDPDRVRELISAGILKPEESWIDLHDFETGARIAAGRGSVYWNEFRRRWVMLISDRSKAGEIWFAEADTPAGPWAYARRVVSHENYNFYNPTQHPFFDQQGGKIIYFEGTYTAAFSGGKRKDAALRLQSNHVSAGAGRPAAGAARAGVSPEKRRRKGALLDAGGSGSRKGMGQDRRSRVFCDSAGGPDAGLMPIYAFEDSGQTVLKAGPSLRPGEGGAVLFLGLPASAASAEQSVDGSWQCTAKTTGDGEIEFDLQLKQNGADNRNSE